MVNFELAVSLEAAGLVSVRQLGKWLRRCCGAGLERVGEDNRGAVWVVP